MFQPGLSQCLVNRWEPANCMLAITSGNSTVVHDKIYDLIGWDSRQVWLCLFNGNDTLIKMQGGYELKQEGNNLHNSCLKEFKLACLKTLNMN